jgi:hypothetical protein
MRLMLALIRLTLLALTEIAAIITRTAGMEVNVQAVVDVKLFAVNLDQLALTILPAQATLTVALVLLAQAMATHQTHGATRTVAMVAMVAMVVMVVTEQVGTAQTMAQMSINQTSIL